MLNISMKPYGLGEMLDRILDHIVSVPWLTLQSKGAIFLVGDKPDELVMKSNREISHQLKAMCARVPFGRCLCGRAAQAKEIQHADSVDSRHENRYKGMSSHGHYCVPIMSPDGMLGVLTLYLKTGHRRNKEEEDFLHAIANVLAGIIERKRAEEALNDSEGRYRSLVENVNLGITLIDTDYNILMTNVVQGKFFKKSSCKLIGKKCFQEFEKREKVCAHCPGTRTMATRLPQETETVGVRDDGTNFSVWIQAFPTFGSEGQVTGFIEVVDDITEKKKAEEEKLKLQSQLIQARKMESIGRLAGGVAHDFNNILSVINGFAELTLLEMARDNPLRNNLESIYSAGKRAADLTQQLLAFSRKQIIKPEILNLNTIIENMHKMLARLIGEDIKTTIATGEKLWNINADRSQIGQIIMNLVINAKDAMPTGGELMIETRNIVFGEKNVKGHPEINQGEYVMLVISDTGPGISDEEKKLIFEPFFTTKEIGKGTGLGLATVYGIVKQNEGFIYVYSEPGIGTSFKVYLPRTLEEIEDIEGKRPEGMLGGDETFLVVEDEAEVRKLTVKILSKLGYAVIEAKNEYDALDICKKYSEKIHLLLTDVVMPKMSGIELSEKIREYHPETNVLYVSGYTEAVIVHHGILKDGMNFLQKPIVPRTLAHTVRKVLDGEEIA
jgi:PAS domain S-box-containing protein